MSCTFSQDKPTKVLYVGYIKRVEYNHIKTTYDDLKEKTKRDINKK